VDSLSLVTALAYWQSFHLRAVESPLFYSCNCVDLTKKKKINKVAAQDLKRHTLEHTLLAKKTTKMANIVSQKKKSLLDQALTWLR